MNWIRFIIVLLVFTLLNSANALSVIEISQLDIRPNLLVIALLFFSLQSEGAAATASAFAIGFAADLSSPDMIMGPYFVSYGVIGTVLSQLRKVVIINHMVHQAIAVFIVTLVTGALAQFLAALKVREAGAHVLLVLLGTSLYTAVAAPFLWPVFVLLTRGMFRRSRSRSRTR